MEGTSLERRYLHAHLIQNLFWHFKFLQIYRKFRQVNMFFWESLSTSSLYFKSAVQNLNLFFSIIRNKHLNTQFEQC